MRGRWLVAHGKWHTVDGKWQFAKYTVIFLLIRVIVWNMEQCKKKKLKLATITNIKSKKMTSSVRIA
jgi:hypothetical protein